MDHPLRVSGQRATPAAFAVPLEGREPEEGLARFTDLPHVCLLHSAAPGHALSRFSFLAADPVGVIAEQADAWPSVRDRIRTTIRTDRLPFPDLGPMQGGWMGWLRYELGTAFARISRHPCEPAPIPDIALALYDWVIVWNHHTAQTWLISTGCDGSGARDPGRAKQRASMVIERWTGAPPSDGMRRFASAPVAVTTEFSADAYQRAVATAIEHVLCGDIFQVNLSQRFTARLARSPLELYRDICRRSAAPMAAFVQGGGVQVLSASPEQFLRFEPATRQVETRPIKGTRPRDADPARDRLLARELEASEKDRAENVMIVDLLRNDLARVCLGGSIRVPLLNSLESHPTVHHLVSTITGVLRPDRDALDLLAATFPGGSITGAPKLRAMAIIRELEPVARGVYSGSIGWIGLDGGMDTSIAIRTVTVTGGMASFHAGGGVTAQSSPADEYQESLDKARALVAAITAR